MNNNTGYKYNISVHFNLLSVLISSTNDHLDYLSTCIMQRLFTVVLVICAVVSFVAADFRKDALDLHNKYRAENHAPPLALSNEVSLIQLISAN